MGIRPYILIARPDHWFKNIIVLPGVVFAAIDTSTSAHIFGFKMGIGIISLCLISSACYVLNEWLDAPYDRFHPLKRNRQFVTMELRLGVVIMEYAFFLIAGITLAALISKYHLLLSVIFCLNGAIYNVQPFRLKDMVVVDIIVESFNNPLRLYFGWIIVTSSALPPYSLVMGYWAAAFFVLGLKRYTELKSIGNEEIAGLYRASFKRYSEKSLLILVFSSGALAWLCLLFFILKYQMIIIATVPFCAALFTWLLYLALRTKTPTHNFDLFFRDRVFVMLFVALLIVMGVCLWPALASLSGR
jgi:4-hydroxybenzoate polyprenyltransferase